MKKYISIILISLFSNLIAGHTIDYGKVLLRHWTISKENKTIDGSFYMLKNGDVFIEDAKNNIIHIPLTSLSAEDKAFAIKKNEWVKELNNQLQIRCQKPIERSFLFEPRSWLAALLFVFLGWYILFAGARKKLKWIIPVTTACVAFTLFSFNPKVTRLMQSTTDPLFIDSAFTPFKPEVNTYWDATYFHVESKGIPTTHPMMAGITGWQQQVPIPQCYIGNNSWSIPLNPVISSSPIPVSPAHFSRGAIAIAVNGIAIFNPYTNTGADAYLTGQLDNWGGHCGRADDYHYHIAPVSLYNQVPNTSPIAFALDGFAVYGSVEPDGSPVNPLDTNNGHFGTNGVYHYHGVSAAPYMIGYMVGLVTEDTTHQIIPQAAAHPVRPSLTPLQGAVITNCQPNATNNGYTLTYTISGNTDSVVYSWTTGGIYTFNFYTATGLTTQNYNGFAQCTVPLAINETIAKDMGVTIYPNPNVDGFIIRINNVENEKNIREINIYDLNGKQVYSTEHYKTNTTIRNLARGTYIVKITLINNSMVEKVIVE